MKNLKEMIRTIPDFPKKGILFRDITPLLSDGEALRETLNLLNARIPGSATKIAGIESRGFIFGAALATLSGRGFVPIRKPGKLPAEKISVEYCLEYGTDKLEMHKDAVVKGERVVIVDDLLATGGTAEAACSLVEKAGGIVDSVLFLIALDVLNGMEKLKNRSVHVLMHF